MLTPEIRNWITTADTFFIASSHPDGPVDASHRGGAPSFVEIKDDRLVVPDYPGNSMFNTFGNLYLNPQAGITLINFETNQQLKLTGKVYFDFNTETLQPWLQKGGFRTWGNLSLLAG